MTEPNTSDVAQRSRAEQASARRIEDLEREYRRLRRFTIALMVGVAMLLGIGASLVLISGRYGVPGTVADVVAARQFVLRGKDGTVRGIWGTEPDGTLRLVLQDTQGHPRTKLNLLNDGSSGLTFSDSTGAPRAVFAVLPDQTVSIVFADGRGKTRSVLGILPDGNPTLAFANRDGATRAGLGVDSRGAGTFTLVDHGGHDLAQPEPGQDGATDTAPAESAAPAKPERRR